MSKSYFFMGTIDTSKIKGNYEDKRDAWMPHTGDGYYDKSAKQYFGTKREKRAWLKANKMRETGELYSKKHYASKHDDPRRIIEGTGGASNRLKGVGR